ncbi:MAG: CPBP family intramembrane metalloprotease [Lachnospiraceae bacterium]|nr:CPBP family intramembrane metalloprotease [Lachnospiraceae bacterium]
MKGIWKAIAYFVLYFGLTMILQVLLSIVFCAVGAANGLNDETLIMEFANNNILGMTVISGILTVLVLYLVFKLRKKQVKQEWKLNQFKAQNIVLTSVIAFSFSFLFALCTYNLSMENTLMISKSVGFYNELVPLFGTIMRVANLLVIAPIAEEIALRGIVYTRVEKTTNAVTAIIVSSVLFGLMHFMAGGIILVIGATLMGLVFGYIFYKFKSLWVCIIAHSVANLPDFILYNKLDISGGIFWGLVIFFACLFIAGLCVIHKTTETNKA